MLILFETSWCERRCLIMVTLKVIFISSAYGTKLRPSLVTLSLRITRKGISNTGEWWGDELVVRWWTGGEVMAWWWGDGLVVSWCTGGEVMYWWWGDALAGGEAIIFWSDGGIIHTGNITNCFLPNVILHCVSIIKWLTFTPCDVSLQIGNHVFKFIC